MSRESSVVREPLRPDLPPVWLASPPGPAATFVRSEESLDQPEKVVPPRPRSMVLRSHSCAGRSKSVVPVNPVGATQPEPETVPPEMEDTPPVGRARREIPGSPDIDSSGETGKTPSGPISQDRPGPEMGIIACPPVPSLSSSSPPFQLGHQHETTHTHHKIFIGSNRETPTQHQREVYIIFYEIPEEAETLRITLPLGHLLKIEQIFGVYKEKNVCRSNLYLQITVE